MQEVTLKSLFEKYKTKETSYDEIFRSQKKVHPFCYDFLEELNKVPQSVFKNLQVSTNKFLYDYGVHNPLEKSENVLSIDCIPRVMSFSDWDFIKKGLEQRVVAINLFLKDIYNGGRIIKDKIVPKSIIHTCANFYSQMKGIKVPNDTYVSIYNANIIRVKDNFFVLEDNVSTSHGASYMLACRQAMMKSFFSIIRKCNVLPVESYCLNLLSILSSSSKREENSTIVLLVSDELSISYFESVFLAYQMGVDFVHPQDILVRNSHAFVKTTKGLKRVDVIYSLLDSVFDPSVFKSDAFLGVPGLFKVYQSGRVALFNTPGSEIIEDKVIYTYIPKIIKYYLKQDPILHNVDLYFCRKSEDKEYTLDNLSKMVVKPIDVFDEQDTFIGPLVSKEETKEFYEKLKVNAKDYLSQPIWPMSTSPCFFENEIKPGYTNNYFFCLYNGDKLNLTSGGLCRSFFKKAQQFIHFSKDRGNMKDIWVIKPSK